MNQLLASRETGQEEPPSPRRLPAGRLPGAKRLPNSPAGGADRCEIRPPQLGHVLYLRWAWRGREARCSRVWTAFRPWAARTRIDGARRRPRLHRRGLRGFGRLQCSAGGPSAASGLRTRLRAGRRRPRWRRASGYCHSGARPQSCRPRCDRVRCPSDIIPADARCVEERCKGGTGCLS